MLQTGLLSNAHNDLITCAAYDYYGLRLATCSLDQRVCIWELDEEKGDWNLKDDWKAHDSPVSCVNWAHPEFGDVLASAGFEGTVKIWEKSLAGGWEEKAAMVDASASVRQIEFAPNWSGLRIAAISTDGWVRVYDCLEQNKLDAWLLAEKVEVNPIPATEEATQPQSASEAQGGWSISWCKEKWWGKLLAVTSGQTGIVKIIRFSPSQSPQTLLNLENTSPSAVTSVSWAPGCGRSYHLVATGARDGHVRIWKIQSPLEDEEGEQVMGDDTDGEETRRTKWEANLVADFDDHSKAGGDVGKVEWNVTGTILSSTGSDGRVRIWKATITSAGRIWRAKGSIGVEQRQNGKAMDEET